MSIILTPILRGKYIK